MNKLIVTAVVLVLVLVGWSVLNDTPELGEIPTGATFSTSSVTLTGTVAQVVDFQSGAYARTYSNEGPDTAYLCFASSTSCPSQGGFSLYASTSKVFSSDEGNLYRGRVYGNTAGTSTVIVTELY